MKFIGQAENFLKFIISKDPEERKSLGIFLFFAKDLFYRLKIAVAVKIVGLEIARFRPLVPAVDRDKRRLHIGVRINVSIRKRKETISCRYLRQLSGNKIRAISGEILPLSNFITADLRLRQKAGVRHDL